MRHLKLFPLFVLLACDCTEEKRLEQKAAFDSFVFSFNGHSMKFTQRDTIFMRRRNSVLGEVAYTTISKETLATVNRFVNSINSTKYDTTYIEQDLQDGIEYKFYVAKGKATTSIYIYGHNGPQSLYSFATWLESLENQQKFCPITAKINFGNLYRVILPPPPPPPH